MNDKKFYHATGPQPSITLRLRKKPPPEKGRGRQGQRPGAPGGVMEGYSPQDEFIPAEDLANIRFYDLGTRLRSSPPGGMNSSRVIEPDAVTLIVPNDDWVNEYLEIRYEARLGLAINFENGQNGLDYDVSLTIDDQTLWSTAYPQMFLGSRSPNPNSVVDPLTYTQANKSHRMLPNCLQLPHKAAITQTEVTIEGGIETLNEQSNGDDWVKDENGATPEIESWNPINTSDDGNVIFDLGKLKREDKRIDALTVKSKIYYESFDTSDAKYKVTHEPHFDAPPVPLDAAIEGMRVFLVPQMLCMGIFSVVVFLEYYEFGDQGSSVGVRSQGSTDGWHGGRLPVYPFGAAVGDPSGESWYPGDFGTGTSEFYKPIEESTERPFLRAVKASLDRRLHGNDKHFVLIDLEDQLGRALTEDQIQTYPINQGTLHALGQQLLAPFEPLTPASPGSWGYSETHSWSASQVIKQAAGALLGVVGNDPDNWFYIWRAEDLTRDIFAGEIFAYGGPYY